jgi:macrolide transport system ATP-binding/permease protein
VISPGARVGLLGPNGCGKTTLLRLVASEEPPDRGSVFVDPHTRVGYLEYLAGCMLAGALHDPQVDAAAEVERLALASSFDPARLPEYQAALDRLAFTTIYFVGGVRRLRLD